MRRRLYRIATVALVVLAVLLLLTAVTPQGRSGLKTVGLVAQVLPSFPVQPLGWFTPEPDRTPITYPSPAGPAQADLYQTGDDGPRPAVVLFLGVSPAGRDDPRVVNLATALARTGYVVLVPWSDNMVSGRVAPEDVELLVAAFQYLESLDYVDPERIGSGGFCVGSSLLTIAAADERIRDDILFVNFFSGYFDSRDYLAQFAARQAYYGDTTRPWDVDPLTEQVFRRLLIEGLPDAAEQEAIRAHVEGDAPMTLEDVALLSPEGQAVFRLLEGTTLEEAYALIEQLPDEMLADMAALSPKNFVDGVRAALWIMHDRDDELAPVEESRRLYDAVGGRENVVYTEFSFFQHVDPGEDAGPLSFITESWKLVRHLYRIVRVTA